VAQGSRRFRREGIGVEELSLGQLSSMLQHASEAWSWGRYVVAQTQPVVDAVLAVRTRPEMLEPGP
jgi:alpha-tubulin suppressor-like RCC1 family protein